MFGRLKESRASEEFWRASYQELADYVAHIESAGNDLVNEVAYLSQCLLTNYKEYAATADITKAKAKCWRDLIQGRRKKSGFHG